MDDTSSSNEAKPNKANAKFVVLVVLVIVAGALAYFFRGLLTLESLAQQESSLREFQFRNPVLIFGLAFLVYVTVTGLSLPGALVLSLVYAWYFGFYPAVVLISFASTSGATIAFLLSRYLLRATIQDRFGERLASFNKALETEGSFYLFTLRLIPTVPFFLINVVMGLTPIKTLTFWWVSQIGMLPGTIVFVYAGSRVPNLQTLAEQGTSGILSPQLVVAFILLGVFPLAVKKLFLFIKRSSVD